MTPVTVISRPAPTSRTLFMMDYLLSRVLGLLGRLHAVVFDTARWSERMGAETGVLEGRWTDT